MGQLLQESGKGAVWLRRLEYTIGKEHDGKSVQAYLIKEHGFSRRLITRLKQEPEHIHCNGTHIRMVDLLHTGDRLTVILSEQTHILPNHNLSVPIVYEDQDVIVFHKPPGMPVHPSTLHYEDTLANFYSYYLGRQGISAAFHPINRLDRDTIGLCLAAKNQLAAKKLSGSLTKEYAAVLCGSLPEDCGEINAPIGREDGSLIKRTVRSDGQPSVTCYQVMKREGDYTWVKIRLLTGRTHQIRVHFSSLGYPLAGDGLYGGSQKDFASQALCCSRLRFFQPITGELVDLCINIQEEMDKIRI